jgi:hypothetical protein
MVMKKNPLRSIFFIFVVAAASLSFAEIILRLPFSQPSFECVGLPWIYDKELLYRAKPHFRADINSMGYRDGEFRKEKKDRKRILFLGDSFVMGMNVKPQETLPKLLEKKLGSGYEVFNMGSVGFGPDQELLALERDGLKLDPNMVVLGLYPANDFNDLYKNKIFDLTKEGALQKNKLNAVTLRMLNSPSQTYNVAKYCLKKKSIAAELNPLFFYDVSDWDMMKNGESRRAKYKADLMGAVLKEFKTVLAAKNIAFLVVIIPSYAGMCDNRLLEEKSIDPKNYFSLEELAKTLCEKESIPYVNLYPLFPPYDSKSTLYDKKDTHLSVQGNEFSAAVIAQKILDGIVNEVN